MTPRRITISARAAATAASPTVPQQANLTQVITDWTYVTPTSGRYYRVIGEAPFKGRVIGAYFIPDFSPSASTSTTYVAADLINAGQDGAGRVALTSSIRTDGLVLLTEEQFDPVAGSSWSNPPSVEEGDLIALRIWHVISGTAYAARPAQNPPDVLTGTVTIWFQHRGGS